MGSYLTIVNDTDYTWMIDVGADMKVLKTTLIILGAIGGIITAGVGIGFASAGIAAAQGSAIAVGTAVGTTVGV